MTTTEYVLNGQIKSDKLPSLVISNTYTAGNNHEQINLGYERGDICIRTGEHPKTYVAIENSPGSENGSMDHWKELVAPTDVYTQSETNTLLSNKQEALNTDNSGKVEDDSIASSSTWNGKQDALTSSSNILVGQISIGTNLSLIHI